MRTYQDILDSLKREGWKLLPYGASVFQASGRKGTLVKVVFWDGRVAEGRAYYQHERTDPVPIEGCCCLCCESARAAKI